uniref:Uncharacterized protein n=1 Tax=Sipha flava TaxID=143950 RepID=A0A2S2QAG9_9HEMI
MLPADQHPPTTESREGESVRRESRDRKRRMAVRWFYALINRISYLHYNLSVLPQYIYYVKNSPPEIMNYLNMNCLVIKYVIHNRHLNFSKLNTYLKYQDCCSIFYSLFMI